MVARGDGAFERPRPREGRVHAGQSEEDRIVAKKRSAEQSHPRKSDPYRSAMSMLTFYINRASKHLSIADRRRLDKEKDELRKLFHREPAKSER